MIYHLAKYVSEENASELTYLVSLISVPVG